MAVDLQGVEQNDFSGGMSDLQTAGEQNSAKTLDNFSLSDEGKPETRPGSRPIDAKTHAQMNAWGITTKIHELLNLEQDRLMLIRTRNKIYGYDGITATEILNPLGFAALYDKQIEFYDPTVSRMQRWGEHAVIGGWNYGTESAIKPRKIFRQSDNTLLTLNASLPKNTKQDVGYVNVLARCMALANDLRTQMNAHFANGVAHPSGIQSTITQAQATDENSLFELISVLVTEFNEHSLDARLYNSGETPAYHQNAGTTWFGSFSLDTTGIPKTIWEAALVLNRLKTVFNCHLYAFSSFVNASTGPNILQHPGAYTPAPVTAAYILGASDINTDEFVFTPGFDITDSVSPDAFAQIVNNLADNYNAHVTDTAGAGGHTASHSAAQVNSYVLAAADGIVAPLMTLWSMIFGYKGHADLTGSTHGSAITDPEKLAIYTDLSYGYYEQYKHSGNLRCWDLLTSSVDMNEFLSFFSDLVTKLEAHVPLARHLAASGVLYNYGDYYRLSATANTVQFAYTHKHSYRTRLGTVFEQESAPQFVWPTAFVVLNPATVTKVSTVSPVVKKYNSVGHYTVRAGLSDLDNNYHGDTKIAVYRTTMNGSVFYKVTELSDLNPYDEFDDTILDDILDTREALYTTETVSQEELPRSRTQILLEDTLWVGAVNDDSYVVTKPFSRQSGNTLTSTAHGFNANDLVYVSTTSGLPAGLSQNTAYYVINPAANTFQLSATPSGSAVTLTTDGTGFHVVGKLAGAKRLNRVVQSIPGNPFFTGPGFYADLNSDVRLLGHARGYPIAVCERGVYRIEGGFDDTGAGSIIPRLISDRIFGLGSQGGITVDDIFYFAALDGIYMCDGFKALQVTPHLKTTWGRFVKTDLSSYEQVNEDISCGYDPVENRLFFSMTDYDSGWSTPSHALVIYLDHMKPGRAPASLWYGDQDYYNHSCTGFWRGRAVRGTYEGFVLEHDGGLNSDPKYDSGFTQLDVDGSQDLKAHIPFDLLTSAAHLNGLSSRKWIPRLDFLAYNHGNLTAQLSHINDLNTTNETQGGSVEFRQDYNGIIRERLSFGAGSTGTYSGLRALLRQLRIQPKSVVLYKSDTYGQVTVSGLTCTVGSTLGSAQLKGRFITIGGTDYEIASKTSGTQFTLVSGPADGSYDWEISDYPLDEKLELISLVFHAQIVESQNPGPRELGLGNQ